MLRTERLQRLFKEGVWIVLGQIMMVFGSLFGVRLMTEFLSPDAYGELALGMTIAALVNQIILGPLGGGFIRFYAPAVEHGNFPGYLNAVKKLVLFATGIIIFLVILSIAGLIIAGQVKWVTITVSALVFAILSGYCANLSGIQTAARQRSIVAIHQGIDPFLRTLIAAILLLWLGMTSTVAMIGYAIAALFMLGSQIFFFRKIIPRNTVNQIDRNWQAEIWRFSWPIGIFGIFTWMQFASDRWSLQLFSTTRDVGKYVVLYQLGYYPISLMTGMMLQFLLPIFYQRAGDASDSQRNHGVNKLSWYLTWSTLSLTGGVFMVVFFSHTLIFRILVAKEYSSVSFLMPWMILAGGMFAAGQTLASNLQAQMKTREMIAAKIVTALFGVMLNFAGAYHYGTTGVVGAGVLFSIFYFLWMAMLSKRIAVA